MKGHIVLFSVLLAFVFLVEGLSTLYSSYILYHVGLTNDAYYSVFLACVQFFIAGGLATRRRWSPHLGIFFQAYLVINLIIQNRGISFSTAQLPSVLTLFSASAFITISLYILRNEFRRQ